MYFVGHICTKLCFEIFLRLIAVNTWLIQILQFYDVYDKLYGSHIRSGLRSQGVVSQKGKKSQTINISTSCFHICP